MNELDDIPPWLTILVIIALIAILLWAFRDVRFDGPKGGRLRRPMRSNGPGHWECEQAPPSSLIQLVGLRGASCLPLNRSPSVRHVLAVGLGEIVPIFPSQSSNPGSPDIVDDPPYRCNEESVCLLNGTAPLADQKSKC
ncbi:hypothetical protein CALVIDRAFT_220421 [Calocera viscosa TUFC12733]|uniref:Uncharacterized protein n=1 Tax=Calocera viscosa (strain TUFC12733) TaxID=1330018 RepID=A0A167RK48_CALVF|nr:hypothetical protein CALVIDRAFT_220421 [Calocera viscosa TUFC12733]